MHFDGVHGLGYIFLHLPCHRNFNQKQRQDHFIFQTVVWTAFPQQISCLFTWQSTSSSQTQLAGMQEEFPHWNSLGAQEDGAHATSSEPSPQSSSPLQTKLREMQRPLAHVNSFGAQVIFPKKCIQKININSPWYNQFCQPKTSGRHLKANLENRTVGHLWLQIWQTRSALKQLGSNI